MFRRCHALDQQQLQQLELNWLEKKLLEACSGLPLALQVIGGSLRVDGANNAEWATKTCKRWQVGCQTAKSANSKKSLSDPVLCSTAVALHKLQTAILCPSLCRSHI
jgi:hypothetical protein